MSLNFDEYDTDVPEKVITTNTSKVTGGIRAPGSEDKAILASAGINPQSSSGLGINPQTINQVWNDVKPYIDPIHYKENTSAAYENIDFPTSIAHGVADVMGAYGVAKGVSYGAKQMFPEPGVAVQRDQMKFQRSEAKRLARGELNPIEKSRLALEQAKTQQILAGLNPAPQAPIAPQSVAPQNAAPSAQAPVAPNAPVTPAPMAPTVQQRAIGGQPAILSDTLPPEVINSPGHQAFTALEQQTGGPITTGTDLKMIQQSEANRLAKEQEALAKAQQAGVTPSTSAPEAQTLVTTHQASLTPEEDLHQKVTNGFTERKNILLDKSLSPEERIKKYSDLKEKHTFEGLIPDVKGTLPEPSTEIQGAVKPKASKSKNPVESMKSYLMGSQGFNEEQYKTLMKDIIGKDLEMPSTGGGFGQKSHPEEWDKYMAWRKENIEGPKSNLNFDIKKKFRDVEKIEDPKMRTTARNALLVSLASLPAFLNAKTSQDIRTAKQNLGEAILPIGMTPTEAGAPVLPPNAFSESRKLGSPFYKMLNQGVAPR